MKEPIDEVERVFLALSDKTRIRLVDLMRSGEVSVNYLCETLGVSQPKVSRHLAYLRAMGIVNTRRDGKWIYYSLSEPQSHFGSQLLRDALEWIRSVSGVERPSPKPRSRVVTSTEESNTGIVENNTYAYTDMNGSAEELEVYLL